MSGVCPSPSDDGLFALGSRGSAAAYRHMSQRGTRSSRDGGGVGEDGEERLAALGTEADRRVLRFGVPAGGAGEGPG